MASADWFIKMVGVCKMESLSMDRYKATGDIWLMKFTILEDTEIKHGMAKEHLFIKIIQSNKALGKIIVCTVMAKSLFQMA